SFIAVACQTGGHALLQRLCASREPGQHRDAHRDSDPEFFSLDCKHPITSHVSQMPRSVLSLALNVSRDLLSNRPALVVFRRGTRPCSIGELGGLGGAIAAARVTPSNRPVLQQVICFAVVEAGTRFGRAIDRLHWKRPHPNA